MGNDLDKPSSHSSGAFIFLGAVTSPSLRRKIETGESYLCLPEKWLLIIMNYLLIKKPVLYRDMLKKKDEK